MADNHTHHNAFGANIRFWRKTLGLSQAELANQLQTAPRHVSFLETGRSKPSREMIDRLRDVFTLNDHESAMLLATAGFLPEDTVNVHADAMQAYARKHASSLLAKLDPYPAIITNTIGDIILCNQAWHILMQKMLPHISGLQQINIFDLYFSSKGLRSIIHNWEHFSSFVLMRLKEQQILTGNNRIQELTDWLQAYPGIPKDWVSQARQSHNIDNYQLSLNINKQRINIKSLISTIQPEPLSRLSRMNLHSYMPQDNTTALFWQKHFETASQTHPLLCDYPTLS